MTSSQFYRKSVEKTIIFTLLWGYYHVIFHANKKPFTCLSWKIICKITFYDIFTINKHINIYLRTFCAKMNKNRHTKKLGLLTLFEKGQFLKVLFESTTLRRTLLHEKYNLEINFNSWRAFSQKGSSWEKFLCWIRPFLFFVKDRNCFVKMNDNQVKKLNFQNCWLK